MKPEKKSWILLSEFFPPAPGGIQQALQVLLQDAGATVHVVTPLQGQSDDFDQHQPYRITRRSLFSGPGKPSWWWLVAWLRQHQSEFSVAVYGHFNAAVTASWILSWFGHRYAILVHGQDVLSEAQRPGRKLLVGTLLRRAAWVGVNSTFTAKVVQGYGLPWSRIVRTHPAVPTELLGTSSQPSGLKLVTVARLVARKNIETVIRAVAALAKDFPKLQYDIFGDGPERQALAELIEKLGGVHSIHLHGRVSDQEKFVALTRATAFVMAPKILRQGSDVEGLGIVYLEAAALGLPIVASATGGVTDIVQDNVNGCLTDPGSVSEISGALKKFLIDEKLCARFGQAGRAIVHEEFTRTVRNRRFYTMLGHWPTSPKVSIIIPVYNHAQTLEATLRSVEQQTWGNQEVIVVNDGSTDNLAPVIEQWRSKITYFEQSNQGAPAARNAGARRATGAYLLFLDADTWLDPTMIEKMVQVLETHSEASFAYSRFRFGPKGFRLHEYSVDQLRQRNYIHTSSLIHRQDFPGFDPKLKRFQDWDLWLTLAEQGKHGLFIREELFRVSQGQGGMKASTWVPRFVYRLPFIGQGKGNRQIERYRQAEAIVRMKHRI